MSQHFKSFLVVVAIIGAIAFFYRGEHKGQSVTIQPTPATEATAESTQAPSSHAAPEASHEAAPATQEHHQAS